MKFKVHTINLGSRDQDFGYFVGVPTGRVHKEPFGMLVIFCIFFWVVVTFINIYIYFPIYILKISALF